MSVCGEHRAHRSRLCLQLFKEGDLIFVLSYGYHLALTRITRGLCNGNTSLSHNSGPRHLGDLQHHQEWGRDADENHLVFGCLLPAHNRINYLVFCGTKRHLALPPIAGEELEAQRAPSYRISLGFYFVRMPVDRSFVTDAPSPFVWSLTPH